MTATDRQTEWAGGIMFCVMVGAAVAAAAYVTAKDLGALP